MTPKPIQWFISADNDSNLYLVPQTRRAKWEKWANLSSTDEASWNPPEWAVPIEDPSSVTFTNPSINGQPI